MILMISIRLFMYFIVVVNWFAAGGVAGIVLCKQYVQHEHTIGGRRVLRGRLPGDAPNLSIWTTEPAIIIDNARNHLAPGTEVLSTFVGKNRPGKLCTHLWCTSFFQTMVVVVALIAARHSGRGEGEKRDRDLPRRKRRKGFFQG